MERGLLLSQAKEFAKKVMVDFDVSHDYSHVIRVYNMSLRIASNYPECDQDKVALLALLHDVLDHKFDVSRIRVENFLKGSGLNDDDTHVILEEIDMVSYSNIGKYSNQKIPLEVRIVQDADRIDAIGAIGIARTFAYSGARNIPFYSEQCTKTTIAHFQEKLLHIIESISTPEGKIIAEDRQIYLRSFLKRFLEEVQISNEQIDEI